jgi:hypothetical protein
MRAELDIALCDKYPKLFANRFADMNSTAMCWGFECGDGWYDLIDCLCCSIQSHIDYNSDKGVSQVVVDQVKEKFGTLRFYTSGSDERINGMIRLAERLSSRICETCGAPGTIRGRHWLYTACHLHTEQQDKISAGEQ